MAPSIQNLISERFASVHHRQLFVISGEEDWCLKQMEDILSSIPDEQKGLLSLLTCHATLESECQTVTTNNTQFRQHLGGEFDFVIYNAWHSIRANALAALSGTIKKNGLLFLLCPSLNAWETYKDAEISSRISFGNVEKFKHSLFIKHLTIEIAQDKKSIYLDKNGLTGNNQKLPEELVQSAKTFHEQTINEELLHEQKLLIEQIKRVSTGHTKRPLVITADRGRGKTAALGIALAQLLQKMPLTILVTAPQKQSVDTLFRHAISIVPQANEHIVFKAVDDLILNFPKADILLVDEAAGIPVQQLKRLTEHYNRIVFTTTVYGYEGSGRGFDIRFKPWLKEFRKDTRFRTLKQPMRWFAGDCLEEFWWRALHLKPRYTFTDNPSPLASVETKKDWLFAELSKQQLLDNQPLLNALFTLLVEAHYQTTPDDFVALLDAPEHQLFALFTGTCEPENLLGVVTGSVEGQFTDETLAHKILSGQRRVQGHMLPQQLAYSSGEKNLLNYRYFRIIRIAVSAQIRKMGVGTELLTRTQRWCLSNNIDMLGSSFGVTEQLLRFWSASAFAPVLLGFHKDKATAEFNITVAKPLAKDVEFIDSMKMLKQSLQEQFAFHLSGIYQDLDNQIVCRLFRYFEQRDDEINTEFNSETNSEEAVNISARDSELLALFINGNRSLELTTPQLKQLLLSKIKSQSIKDSRRNRHKSNQTCSLMTTEHYDLLIDFLLKRIPLTQLLQKHRLEGKKHFQSTIKERVLELAKKLR